MSDYYNHRAQKFDNNGNFLRKYTSDYASGIGVSANGNVYVGERFNNRITKYNPNGGTISRLSTGYAPYGISIHNDIVHVITMWQAIQL